MVPLVVLQETPKSEEVATDTNFAYGCNYKSSYANSLVFQPDEDGIQAPDYSPLCKCYGGSGDSPLAMPGKIFLAIILQDTLFFLL